MLEDDARFLQLIESLNCPTLVKGFVKVISGDYGEGDDTLIDDRICKKRLKTWCRFLLTGGKFRHVVQSVDDFYKLASYFNDLDNRILMERSLSSRQQSLTSLREDGFFEHWTMMLTKKENLIAMTSSSVSARQLNCLLGDYFSSPRSKNADTYRYLEIMRQYLSIYLEHVEFILDVNHSEIERFLCFTKLWFGASIDFFSDCKHYSFNGYVEREIYLLSRILNYLGDGKIFPRDHTEISVFGLRVVSIKAIIERLQENLRALSSVSLFDCHLDVDVFVPGP